MSSTKSVSYNVKNHIPNVLISYSLSFNFCPVTVTVASPSRYRLDVNVPHRYPTFINVTDLYLPLHTVTSTLSAVTLTLLIVTSTKLHGLLNEKILVVQRFLRSVRGTGNAAKRHRFRPAPDWPQVTWTGTSLGPVHIESLTVCAGV